VEKSENLLFAFWVAFLVWGLTRYSFIFGLNLFAVIHFSKASYIIGTLNSKS